MAKPVLRRPIAARPRPKPLLTDGLDREIAAPTTAGVRSVLSDNPSEGLDPARLAYILRAAAEGDPDQYLALAEMIEEKYLHYQGVLATRKRSVTQLDITVEAAGDDERSQADAELIREWLNRDELEDETFDIMDAVGKGFSVTEMVWDFTSLPWFPALKTRDPRWFEFDRVDRETLRLKGGPDGNSALPTDLPPNKFIVHRTAGKTGTTIRGGLARSVAWAYLFQNFALKDWVIFADVYGMPIRVGKYDKNATVEDRRSLLRAVSSIATDAAAIIPASMSIDFEQAASGTGGAVFKELAEYLDQQVSKVVVGQTATTDAVAGGLGSGQSNVHNDVREDIQRADSKKLAATLNRDAVRPIVNFNNGPPPNGKYPRIKIGQAERLTKERAELIYGYVDRGARVEQSIVGDLLGLPDAPEGKTVKLLQARTKANSSTSAENAPPVPNAPANDAEAAKALNAASNRILGHLKGALETAPAVKPVADPIDGLVDTGADHWIEIVAPMIDGLDDLVQSSASLTDFRDRLAGHIDKMDDTALTDLLARSLLTARLAGEAGLKE